MKFTNPFTAEGNWYKANLHCHTTKSDGRLTPEERVEKYRDRGYSVLAITDHAIVTDMSSKSSDDFIAIKGIEGHPHIDEVYYHIVGLNVPADFTFDEEETPQGFADRINKAGGMAVIAHPYWLGLETPDITAIEGIAAIEVFNALCGDIGKSTASVHWDNLLQKGIRIPAIAVDDSHREDTDTYHGWVWLKLKKLSTESVINALKTGCFYSSSGPEIKNITVDGRKITVESSPAKIINFFGYRWHGKRVLAEQGATITTAGFEAGPEEPYLRIECIDAEGNTAWSNPFFFD